MKGKILWLVVSGLMVLSLVMAACGPAAVEEEKGKEAAPVVKEEKAKEEKGAAEKEVVEKEVVSPEAPKYGGWLNLPLNNDPRGWDETKTLHFWIYSNQLTNQMLLNGDWTRGPAGTGEFTWTSGTSIFADKTPNLAESYEIVEPGHIRWKVRPGIHFGLNPDSEASRLVGGREYTADDLAFTLKYVLTTPKSYINRSVPLGAKTAVFTVTDKYTLDLTLDPADFYNAIYFLNVWAIADVPHEVIEKYGDMNDWSRVVGTGPFLLTDYVPGSVQTLIRNPNFWQTDPVGPGKGNQLPYVDGVKELIIPDLSTRQAALRTGKIDELSGVSWEDAQFNITNSPQLEYLKAPGAGSKRIFFRTDKPELPIYDLRVRRALHMAVNFNEIVATYFNGEASLRYAWPCCGGANKDAITKPIAERSAEIQELYAYKPEKAKELLAEAGYPDGFTIKVTVQPMDVDYLSLIKYYWEQIGVDLQMDVKEPGAFSKVLNSRAHEQAIYSGGYPGYIRLGSFIGDSPYNASMIDDPFYMEMRLKLQDLFFASKQDELDRIYRDEIAPYVFSKVYVVPTPVANTYIFWSPWLKNFYGANGLGWTSWPQFARYVWIDQELKKKMGY